MTSEFTDAHPLLPATAGESVCLNCGTTLSDLYCSHCAQPARIAIPTVGKFLGELADKLLSIQGKLPLTLWTLLRHPGQVTCDYLAGRRERYLKPLNLYVAVSLTFFLLLSLVPGISVRVGATLEINTEAVAESRIEGHTGIAELDRRLAMFGTLPMDRRNQVLRDGMIRNAPRAMFALVPLFALLMKGLYPRRYYGEHLLFALHFHSVAFLALVPGLMPWPQPFHDVVNNLINIVLLVHLFVALRAVYGGSWLVTLPRIAAIIGVYVVTLSSAVLAGVLLSTAG